MKKLIVIVLWFVALGAFAQTSPSLPVGSMVYGNTYFLDTDGNVWAGSAAKQYRVVAQKSYVDSINVLGWSNAQIDSAISSKVADYVPLTQKGAADGVATLDGSTKIPMSQIPDALVGSVNYQGNYNASTNTPTLPSSPSSGTKGHYYVVATGGTQFGETFAAGDWIISNGSEWQKVDNNNAVTSVAGKVGAVTLNVSDVNGALAAGDNVSLLTNDAGYITSSDVPAPPVTSVNSKTGAVVINASDVGLGNVDNTSDIDKPISNAMQSALDGKEDTFSKGTLTSGTGVNLSGVLTNRLIGSGNVGISIDAGWSDGRYVRRSTSAGEKISGTGSTGNMLTLSGPNSIGNTYLTFETTTGVRQGLIGNASSLSNNFYVSSYGSDLIFRTNTGTENMVISNSGDINIPQGSLAIKPTVNPPSIAGAIQFGLSGGQGAFIRGVETGGASNSWVLRSYTTSENYQMDLNSGGLKANGDVTVLGSGNKVSAPTIEATTNIIAPSFTRTTTGLVPTPGGSGTTRFLREDGSWVVPDGGGGGGTATDLSLGTRTSTTMVINSSTGTNVTLPIAITSLAGLMSAGDKIKLEGIESGANNYSLPTASASTLGGIKVGSNLSISSGVLSATNTTYTNGSGLNLSGNSFSANFGTSSGTVAQGNDSRINNGQTAYNWGNHSGLYLPLSGGTLSGELDVSYPGYAQAEITGTSGGQLVLNDSGAGTNAKKLILRTDGGVGSFISIRDDGNTAAVLLTMNHLTGRVTVGNSFSTSDMIVNTSLSLPGTTSQYVRGDGSFATFDAVPTSRTISAGTGLTGGGNLTANRTISVNFGTSSGTVAQGNDSRINNGQTAYSWGNHASAGYSVNGTGSSQVRTNSQLDARYLQSVSGGSGISVSGGSTVAVDGTVVRTSGTQTVGGSKTFSSPVSGPDGIANNHFVTKQQIPALASQGTGIVRLVESAQSGLFSGGTGTYLKIGTTSTEYSVTIPAGTFSGSKGFMRIKLNGQYSSTTPSNYLYVEYSQGANKATGQVFVSRPSTPYSDTFNSTITCSSRGTTGLFYQSINTSFSSTVGNHITQGAISGIDFRDTFTVKFYTNVSTLDISSILPLTIEVADLN